MKKQALNKWQLERVLKGAANHRRIEILILLSDLSDISLEKIAAELQINYKTASVHVARLTLAGLVFKYKQRHTVRHKLSPRGKKLLKFIKTIE